MKKCDSCGRLFIAHNARHRFCSFECRLEDRKRKNLGLGKCHVCSKEFVRKSAHHRFCSTKCWKKDYYGESSIHGVRLRFFILQRDGFKCIYCGRNPREDGCKLEVDHMIPKSKGGKDHPNNLVTACVDCNQGKSDVLLLDANLRTLRPLSLRL